MPLFSVVKKIARSSTFKLNNTNTCVFYIKTRYCTKKKIRKEINNNIKTKLQIFECALPHSKEYIYRNATHVAYISLL